MASSPAGCGCPWPSVELHVGRGKTDHGPVGILGGMTMVRFYDLASWLVSSLGVALLALSLMLVPQQGAFADDGVGGTSVSASCSSTTGCDDGCKICAVNGTCIGGDCDCKISVSGCATCTCEAENLGTPPKLHCLCRGPIVK